MDILQTAMKIGLLGGPAKIHQMVTDLINRRETMTTRQAFESQGYTFRRGSQTDDGRFQMSDGPQDACPAYMDDLLVAGYVPVDGGIMEPPRPDWIKSLLVVGLVAGGIYAYQRVKCREEED